MKGLVLGYLLGRSYSEMSANTVDDDRPADDAVNSSHGLAGLLTKTFCGLMEIGLALLIFVIVAVPIFIALIVLVAIIMSIF